MLLRIWRWVTRLLRTLVGLRPSPAGQVAQSPPPAKLLEPASSTDDHGYTQTVNTESRKAPTATVPPGNRTAVPSSDEEDDLERRCGPGWWHGG